MITTALLRSIEPKRGRPTKSVPDGKIGGLSIRYGARGVVEFTVVYRFNRQPTQFRKTLGYWWDVETLGPPPSDRWVTLEQARIAALTLKDKAHRGLPEASPILSWAVAVATEPEKPAADSVTAIIDQYSKDHLSKLRSGSVTERLLRAATKGIAEKPIGGVTRANVRTILDGYMKRGKGFMANRFHQAMGQLFTWALDRELVAVSPMANMARPMRTEQSRDRVLSDAELAKVWNAADLLHAPRRDAVRFLVLTGLRRVEGSTIRWADIDGDVLTIPKERSKNKMALTVPLSPQALELINAQPRRCEFVFTYNGKGPVSDLSTYKARTLDPAAGIPNWVLHDLRRTMASGMQRLGVKPEIIDKCLGHSVVIKGVAAVYMRAEYMDERRVAFERWGNHVASII